MNRRFFLEVSMLGVRVIALVLVMTAAGASVGAAQAPDSARLLAAQREAMKPLAGLHGVWRGPAWMILPDGTKETMTQTERVGSFLDGTITIIEGRGYDTDGTVGFNALGVVSYDPGDSTYSMRSHAMGHRGDFPFSPTADGFSWDIVVGPVTIHYVATIKDGVWHEVGDRSMFGQDPVRFFEMTLNRVGDTDWPAAGAVPPK